VQQQSFLMPSFQSKKPAACMLPHARPFYLTGIQEEEEGRLLFEEHAETSTMVSIHPYITVIGVTATITTFIFCTALVLIPLATDYHGSLTYISNGMELHCGWSGTILGSCGILIAACEMIAALHTTMSTTLAFTVLLQASSWCMIMGVSDTGWGFHYCALCVFLASTLYFHHSLCKLHPFDTYIYRKVNTITVVNTALFFISFVITSFVTSETAKWVSLDITVSFELTLMCSLTAQNLCVVRALNQYKSIHLLFDRQS
jgi:hypothetical protein